MKKWFIRLVIALVVLAGTLYLLRNFIARKSVEVGVRAVTGFPLEIGSVNVGLFSSRLDVRELKLMNPPEFQDAQFVEMPRLRVDYRLGSMLRGAPHINDMLVDIKHLTLVKNAKGQSNAMKLKGMVSSDKPSTTKYRVDKLRVHVGSVTIKDYSRAKPTERTLNLNIDATYKNITDSTDISRLVLLTIAGQVSLPDMGIKTEDLEKGLTTITDSVGKAGKSVLDTLKKTVVGK
jgi:uncharacterized protein involved in outer membrane biogenesis